MAGEMPRWFGPGAPSETTIIRYAYKLKHRTICMDALQAKFGRRVAVAIANVKDGGMKLAKSMDATCYQRRHHIDCDINMSGVRQWHRHTWMFREHLALTDGPAEQQPSAEPEPLMIESSQEFERETVPMDSPEKVTPEPDAVPMPVGLTPLEDFLIADGLSRARRRASASASSSVPASPKPVPALKRMKVASLDTE